MSAQAPLVVKVGGSEGIDLDAVSVDLADLWGAGRRVVLVHGGSDRTNRVASALGRPPRFVTSPSGHTSRFTDRDTLEVFAMVYAGAVNKEIVERLQQLQVPALGLAGVDGRLLEGRHKRSVRSLEDGKVRVLHGDHTGTVERVNAPLLELLLGAGYLPVVTPPAISHEGVMINVDGDRAAAAIAAALGAAALVIISNVPGLLADVDDPDSLIAAVARDELEGAMTMAGGRMKKKLLGAREALEAGVQRVVIGDARVAAPITSALAGRGTVIA